METMIKMLQEIQPHWQILRPYLSLHNEQDDDRPIKHQLILGKQHAA